MIIGCTKEIRTHEYRVGLTPENVRAYVAHGHKVYIEKGAGLGAGYIDQDYIDVGAVILDTPQEVFGIAEMIVKVKEPEPSEWKYFKEGQILFTFLHLAANKPLADELLNKKINAVAYETITDKKGQLPCLKPMSQIAGRLSIQEGAKYLEKAQGGRGILMGGIKGVPAAQVVIIGVGVAGTAAMDVADGMGAEITILDINKTKIEEPNFLGYNVVKRLQVTKANIIKSLTKADLVICSVLIPGEKAPKLIKREYLKKMKPGSVIVDISIDQGGCLETSRVTTHQNPVYVEEGVIHYSVGNLPGVVPISSTIALTNATLKYGLLIADNGLEKAIALDKGLKIGVNTYQGKCVNNSVAKALGYNVKQF